ncbi:MAG: hypothetical protein K0Q57_440 [Gammaproteobacteria bacterium]|jgi:hypothetical protein|nr:hypothetical protein [Gammaproteobacteria bacterium]
MKDKAPKTQFNILELQGLYQPADLKSIIRKFCPGADSQEFANFLNTNVLAQIEFLFKQQKNELKAQDKKDLVSDLFSGTDILTDVIKLLINNYGKEGKELLIHEHLLSQDELQQEVNTLTRFLYDLLPQLQRLKGYAITGKHKLMRATPKNIERFRQDIISYDEQISVIDKDIVEAEATEGKDSDTYKNLLIIRAAEIEQLEKMRAYLTYVEQKKYKPEGNTSAEVAHAFVKALAILYYKQTNKVPTQVPYNNYAEIEGNEACVYKNEFLSYVWELFEVLRSKVNDNSLSPRAKATLNEMLAKFKPQQKKNSERSEFLSYQKKFADIINQMLDEGFHPAKYLNA